MATSCVAGPAVDTVTADPDLLALEFEAIIAANYPPSADRVDRRPPVARCPALSGVDPRGDGTGTDVAGGREVRTARRQPHARERSPPAADTRQS